MHIATGAQNARNKAGSDFRLTIGRLAIIYFNAGGLVAALCSPYGAAINVPKDRLIHRSIDPGINWIVMPTVQPPSALR